MKEPAPKTRRFPKTAYLLGGTALLIAVGAVIVAVQPTRLTDLQQAEKALADHDSAAAVTALRAHLSRHPDAHDIRYQLALLLKEADVEGALAELNKIPSVAPEYLAAARQIAVICLLAERYQQAEKSLLIIEQFDPLDFGVQLSLAENYYHQRKYKQALPHALRAAELEPDRVQTQILIADIFDGSNRRPDMIPPLRRAIELDPDRYEAHLNLAYAYYDGGQLKAAQREANWCLQRKPDEVFTHRVLALVARDEGRFDAAQVELRKALELDGDDVDCRILEADLLMYHRRPDEAYKRLKPLFEQHKTTTRYLGSLARAAAASGRINEAQQLHEAISRQSESKKENKE
jgi:predicted Zn-dependent protease